MEVTSKRQHQHHNDTTSCLPQWIQRARLSLSKDDFIQCALTLAIELTNNLSGLNLSGLATSCSSLNADADDIQDTREVVGAIIPRSTGKTSSSLSLDQLDVRLEDIISENIYVSSHSHPTENDKHAPQDKSVNRVQIRPPRRDFNPSDIFETDPAPELSSQALCFALGKILLELFSECVEPLLMIELGANNHDSFGDLVVDLDVVKDHDTSSADRKDEEGDQPPASKRTWSGTTTAVTSSCTHSDSTSPVPLQSSIKSLNAKNMLLEEGLPLSLCQIISDLIEAEPDNPYICDKALLSLEEVLFELNRMKAYPERFLFDQLCPRKALENTALFHTSHQNRIPSEDCNKIFGRDREVGQLLDVMTQVSLHAPSPYPLTSSADSQQHRHNTSKVMPTNDFMCKAVFLSGPGGCGKTSIIQKVVPSCTEGDWFVLFCKFDKEAAPLTVLLHAFETFFQKFLLPQDGHLQERERFSQVAFDKVARSIINSVESPDCFIQLGDLIPSFKRLFPMSTQYAASSSHHTEHVSSRAIVPGTVGSGKIRLVNLCRIIFKAVCSGGYPVFFCLEDMHWCDAHTLDIIQDFLQSADYDSVFSSAPTEPFKGALLLLGSYRGEEVDMNAPLKNQLNSLEKVSNGSKISIGSLAEEDVNEMISFKLCLPLRYARQLAALTVERTDGHPLYAIEFLGSIIQRNDVSFSVRDRRWVWDGDNIEKTLMPECVAELLTKKLMQLPYYVVDALKVLSCIGAHQVNESVITILNEAELSTNMSKALEIAVGQGVMTRADSRHYSFCHEMLRETSYSLIPANERDQLHKRIGTSLAQDKHVADNPELYALAADQYCNISHIGSLDRRERYLFATVCLKAGKISLASSNFDQARKYFEVGISMLCVHHWAEEYFLSLDLYEMSVVVSFMDGQVDVVWARLQNILSNATSFEDTLTSRMLQAKFLVYQENYAAAESCVLEVLSRLGEAFPREVTLEDVKKELNFTQPLLVDLTKEKMLSLPNMTDHKQLAAMKFMGLLITISNFSSPLLMHLLSCRMIQRSFLEWGFCEDTILGLAFVSFGLLQYSDGIWLAAQVNRIAESLATDHPNKHSLQARFAPQSATVKTHVEPQQAVVEYCLTAYHSAINIGDLDSAMNCGLTYCIGSFYSVGTNLMGLQKEFGKLLIEMDTKRHLGLLRSCMSFLEACTNLTGAKFDSGVKMKTNAELYKIAKDTDNSFLTHHVIINQMHLLCFYRKYRTCATLAKQFDTTAKRALRFHHRFYEGISSLCLAVDTKQSEWREIGEHALNSLIPMLQFSRWNFANKVSLLQALLHYVDGEYADADLAYNASIQSAHQHRFFHEEALAMELYGIFLVENKNVSRGLEMLQIATDKYKEWGATKKAQDVNDFVDVISHSLTRE